MHRVILRINNAINGITFHPSIQHCNPSVMNRTAQKRRHAQRSDLRYIDICKEVRPRLKYDQNRGSVSAMDRLDFFFPGSEESGAGADVVRTGTGGEKPKEPKEPEVYWQIHLKLKRKA